MQTADLLQEIDQNQVKIDALRPIPPDRMGRILQKLHLDWNWHSNAIEGNSLTYRETRALLMHGLTASGKPLKDHLDIQGHAEAVKAIEEMATKAEDLREVDIRNLHEMLLKESYEADAVTLDGKTIKRRIALGQYKTAPNHVATKTGAMFYFASPEETPAKMGDLVAWYNKERENPETHPLILAAMFHHRFVAIHPFDDGNGRMGRLLMNLILMQKYFPPVIIRTEPQFRDAYYNALSLADGGEIEALIQFMGESLLKVQDAYIKGAKGESIDEPDDLDKELALFKKELEGKEDRLVVEQSVDIQADLYDRDFKRFIIDLENNVDKFAGFFFGINWSNTKKDVHDFQNPFYVSSTIYLKEIAIEIFNYLEYYLKTEILNEFQLSIIFQEFKQEKYIDLDINLKINFVFERLKYKITYYVNVEDELENVKPLISKYYHESLSEAEIQEGCNKIGKSVLDFIKAEIGKEK